MKRRAADLEANGAELMPREKLMKYGIEELNLPELLALVLGTGYGGKNVMQLSNEIVMGGRHQSELAQSAGGPDSSILFHGPVADGR